MFSFSEISTLLKNRNTMPAATSPLAIEASNPKPTQRPEQRVSKYPVPPNQARNAVSVTKLKGETPPLWAACPLGSLAVSLAPAPVVEWLAETDACAAGALAEGRCVPPTCP